MSQNLAGLNSMSHLQPFATTFLRLFEEHRFQHTGTEAIELLSLDDAYAVQQQVINARIAKGEAIVGYKVGCTSEAIRQQFGLSEPICGRLMAPHVLHGDAVLNHSDFFNCAVEPEFVLGIGEDLTDEVGEGESLIDAIDFVSPGIEVHNYRFWFGNPTSQELIASNGIHACLVVGDQKTQPDSFEWDMEEVGVCLNDELAASGTGAQIMGGPMKSLRWLVNHLVRRGESLKSGQLVIPGSPVNLISVEPGDRVTSRLAHVGQVQAEFKGKP